MKEIIKHLKWFNSREISDLRLRHFPFNIVPAIWQLPQSLEFHLAWLLILTLKCTFLVEVTNWLRYSSFCHSYFCTRQVVFFFFFFVWFLLCLFSSHEQDFCNFASKSYTHSVLTPIWPFQLSGVAFSKQEELVSRHPICFISHINTDPTLAIRPSTGVLKLSFFFSKKFIFRDFDCMLIPRTLS